MIGPSSTGLRSKVKSPDWRIPYGRREGVTADRPKKIGCVLSRKYWHDPTARVV